MEWKHVIYITIIALLYIPMVFLGATTFFEKDSEWFDERSDCYSRLGPYPASNATPADIERYTAEQNRCYQENEAARLDWEARNEGIEANRYIFISIANLVVLAIAAFVPVLTSAVALGLFIGSTIATFIATLTYFDSVNPFGFILLVVLFLIVVYFISKWTLGKKKARR